VTRFEVESYALNSSSSRVASLLALFWRGVLLDPWDVEDDIVEGEELFARLSTVLVVV